MTVMGVRAASATATAVLPTPVGPTITGVGVWGWGLGAAKAAFQLLFRQLHHRGTAVHVMGGEGCREQAHDQLAHLSRVERLSRLDRGSTRVGRGEALQPILPAPKSPAGEIGDELLQAACGLEARMGVRRR